MGDQRVGHGVQRHVLGSPRGDGQLVRRAPRPPGERPPERLVDDGDGGGDPFPLAERGEGGEDRVLLARRQLFGEQAPPAAAETERDDAGAEAVLLLTACRA